MDRTYTEMMNDQHRAEIAAWVTMVKEFCESLGGSPIAVAGAAYLDVARVMLEQAMHERVARTEYWASLWKQKAKELYGAHIRWDKESFCAILNEREELRRRVVDAQKCISWAAQFTCPKCGPCSYAMVTTKKTCLHCDSILIRGESPLLAQAREEGKQELRDAIKQYLGATSYSAFKDAEAAIFDKLSKV